MSPLGAGHLRRAKPLTYFIPCNLPNPLMKEGVCFLILQMKTGGSKPGVARAPVIPATSESGGGLELGV